MAFTDSISLPPKIPDLGSESDLAVEGKSLLTEDAFSSERSQKLFEAIDELQSCGANRDIDLPEVSTPDSRLGICAGTKNTSSS